ncbi:uncharacterized protein BX663DRAFT_512940 [Cokeromyces recurvatus]|uniref:uncharacterized protein n=1 Tax=Cokeromyces recurvatus TaxID=90255 RepID=UPI00221FDCE8|nr:uncharacterized protein BX663DRAFT_512940 [Cokeromyces recurvatus]KAI7901932.1 hypothetical protein BX663DRAFT_512940 [Cokeromyces recurvatus]
MPNAVKIICLVLTFHFIIRPIIRTWNWREDEFKLFELSEEMKNNNTDFYTWLGIEPTATLADISKAHRQLVMKLHPETSKEMGAEEKFEITNHVAYFLRSSTLRPLYDSILLENHGKAPCWKGFYYLYTRHKLSCMVLLSIITLSVLEYIKSYDNYLTEKLAIEEFIKNANLMAQKISDKRQINNSNETHKSFIDLGDRTIECEITAEKEIFIFNEKKEKIPLSTSNLLKKPSILHISLFRYARKLFNRKQY